MHVLNKIFLVLLIIGGINWGLVGLFQYDLVAALFGGTASMVSRFVYTLVGIAGLYCITMLFYRTSDHDLVEEH